MLDTYEMACEFFGGGHWLTRFYDMPIFSKNFEHQYHKIVSLKYVVHQDKVQLFYLLTKAVWVPH
jgi:hypothetical protein